MLFYLRNPLKQAGVHVMVFGVETPDSSQLRAIVSQTGSVFRAVEFDEIPRLETELISLICVQAEPSRIGINLVPSSRVLLIWEFFSLRLTGVGSSFSRG